MASYGPVSEQLLDGLQSASAFPHPVDDIRICETHISWVILTGEFAYKIKKPVKLGFLDFSSLERRRRFCNEELRLNRRFSPDLYLDVVPVAGSPAAPRIGGAGNAIEYAVKMRQFPDEALLSRQLSADSVRPEHIDALARTIAEFHETAAVAAPDSPWGTHDAVWAPVAENFRQLQLAKVETPQVRQLHQWSREEFQRLQSEFNARKSGGFVRECHGDLHANNLLLLGGRLRMFDCVEFNESFRWIDVLSDLAFACMDLADFGRVDFANRLLNAYLQITGDYEGLTAWRYYFVYRALVRAKVAAIRSGQAGAATEQAAAREELQKYLSLAERKTKENSPRLLITHGPSGSGKSTLTQTLLEQLGAVRIRSDVERQRINGHDSIETRYSLQARQRVYDRLADLAQAVLSARMTVIVDATFLSRTHRTQFRELAIRASVPFVILDLQTPIDVLRKRVAHRRGDASEADVDVLNAQLETADPLDDDERQSAIVIDTTSADPLAAALNHLSNPTSESRLATRPSAD